MARNFDEERQFKTDEDRDFVLRGQFFRARASVRPEVLVPFEEMGEDTPASEALRIIDDLVLAMVEPTDDAAERYRAIREQLDDPLSMGDLEELAKWLFEVTSGRPTVRPGDSSTGPDVTGTT